MDALDWAGLLHRETTSLWARVAPRSNGFFYTDFDRTWAPLTRSSIGEGRATATLVSQSRLLYVFAAGARRYGGVFPDLCASGAEFLIRHFRDHAYGGWYWSCDQEGTVRDDRKSAYGHAFVIFGLSHAYAACGDPRFLDHAERTRAEMSYFRDSRAGKHGQGLRNDPPEDPRVTHGAEIALFGSADRRFHKAAGRGQNPLMHYVEALLALARYGERPEALREAHALSLFMVSADRRVPIGAAGEHAAIPEYFGEKWKPAGGPNRSSEPLILIGHQFEWAYLLSELRRLASASGYPVGRGHSSAVDPEIEAAYDDILNLAVEYGVDESGAAVISVDPSGSVSDARKRFWEQCEAIRALHRDQQHGASLRSQGGHRLRGLRRFFDRHMRDPEYGGVYTVAAPNGAIENDAKGGTWKVDYHVVGMAESLLSQEVQGSPK
jgi:mannobiose 2-epimerase